MSIRRKVGFYIKNLFKKTIEVEDVGLSDVLEVGIRNYISKEVQSLETMYLNLAKQGEDMEWTSGLINRSASLSKETLNYIRNKSLEIFLKRNKEAAILKSESGWDYEQYNVLIKIRRKDN